MSDIVESTAATLSRAAWQALLLDEQALLNRPGAHHKMLIVGANAMYSAQLISSYDLSDLLEQADGALAYAVEALLDEWEVGER